MLILNAFSLNMIVGDANVAIREVSQKVAASLAANCTSAVGHADTAAVFSHILGVEIPCNRATVALRDGDVALVGQYSGPRLPEGATTLPRGCGHQVDGRGVKAPLLEGQDDD